MKRSSRWLAIAACIAVPLQACGDDEPEVDGGADASDAEAGRGGRGGRGGSDAGTAGRAGGGAGSGGRAGSAGDDPDAGSDDDTQAVTIQFKAKVGDKDLRCGEDYADFGSTKKAAQVQDFRFFVEEVRLISRSGEEVRVELDDSAPFQTRDVALIDFTDREGQCSMGGATVNTRITGKVPRGEYTGIVFVNGVPETLNHQNLTLAKAPLQDASTHWGWAMGYRFIMTAIAVAGDGGGSKFVHIGSGGCTGTNMDGYECARPNRNRVVLTEFDPANDVIVADLGKVFEAIDLGSTIECHGPAPECGPAYAVFGIDLGNGSALGSQQVFRAE